MHGGALIDRDGELCGFVARRQADSPGVRTHAVDYRNPLDRPYPPAAIDDGVAVYKALLREHQPGEVVFHGASGGGNLITAVLLRARDEGMPLPVGVLLVTPEVDGTESGYRFHTNPGADPGIRSLMPSNLLYADGNDTWAPLSLATL